MPSRRLVVAAAERSADARADSCPPQGRAVLTWQPDGSGTFTDLARQASRRIARHGAAQGRRSGRADLHLGHHRALQGRHDHARQPRAPTPRRCCILWRFRPDDVLLHALPIFHVHGLFVALHTCLLQRLASMLWLPKFDLETVMRLLPQATMMMGVPTFYTRLLATPRSAARPCRSMRLFISGSAPLLAETHSEFEARTGHAHPRALRHDRDRHEHLQPLRAAERLPGTVGYALPGVCGAHRRRGRARRCRAARSACSRSRGPNVFKRLLAQPGEDARGVPPRRLFHDRRPRHHGAGRPRHHRRPRQGPDHHGRLQRLPEGDRGGDQRPARRGRGGGRRRAASRFRRRRDRRRRQGRRAPRRPRRGT